MTDTFHVGDRVLIPYPVNVTDRTGTIRALLPQGASLIEYDDAPGAEELVPLLGVVALADEEG